MTGVTQTITVGDGSGLRGNCLQAAVASFMKVDLGFVPDFANLGPLDDGGFGIWWWELFNGYFVSHGYLIRTVGLSQGNKPIPDQRCLLFGPSPRGNGIQHVVVAEHGDVIWDPHPSRDGLVVHHGAWIPERIDELRAIVRARESR